MKLSLSHCLTSHAYHLRFTASEPDAPSTCPAHPESEPVEPLEPLEPVPEQVPEPVAPVAVPAVRPISSSPDHGEMAKPVAGGARSAHRRSDMMKLG